jgi:peroxiredoxin
VFTGDNPSEFINKHDNSCWSANRHARIGYEEAESRLRYSPMQLMKIQIESAISNTIPHCPGCLKAYEKSGGCNHMRCRCKTISCFVCSRQLAKSREEYDKMRQAGVAVAYMPPDSETDSKQWNSSNHFSSTNLSNVHAKSSESRCPFSFLIYALSGDDPIYTKLYQSIEDKCRNVENSLVERRLCEFYIEVRKLECLQKMLNSIKDHSDKVLFVDAVLALYPMNDIISAEYKKISKTIQTSSNSS